jgi:AP-5 complex subunit mu-1
MVAKLIGDIIMGDMNEPDVILSTVPTVGGLLDSITVGITIAARTKPITVQAQPAIATGTVASGKIALKPADKDALRSFVTSSMPFGLNLS